MGLCSLPTKVEECGFKAPSQLRTMDLLLNTSCTGKYQHFNPQCATHNVSYFHGHQQGLIVVCSIMHIPIGRQKQIQCMEHFLNCVSI